MRFLAQIIITIALVYIGQYFLPWWHIVFVGAIVAYKVNPKSWSSFIAGFIAVFGLYYLQIYFGENEGGQVLSTAFGKLFKIGATGLVFLSAFIGGICTAFGAATGAALKQWRFSRDAYR